MMFYGNKDRIHYEASRNLRENSFPSLRNDEVVRTTRYDRLILLFGNKQCQIYSHQHKLIGSNLRLLGKLLALKNINKEVTDFASQCHPKYYDDVIAVINLITDFNETNDTYKTSSKAYNMGSLVKKIGDLYLSDRIRHDDVQIKKKIKISKSF